MGRGRDDNKVTSVISTKKENEELNETEAFHTSNMAALTGHKHLVTTTNYEGG